VELQISALLATDALLPPTELGPRMREFLKWLSHPDGYTCKEIAQKMESSTNTLRTWRERYGLRGKVAIVGWAVVRGLG